MTNQTTTNYEPRPSHNTNLPKLVGVIILKTPSLIIRCGGEFLKFRIQARKASRIFQQELEQQGMDAATALRLTEVYQSGSDILRLIKSAR